jgi:hypothetical protein
MRSVCTGLPTVMVDAVEVVRMAEKTHLEKRRGISQTVCSNQLSTNRVMISHDHLEDDDKCMVR